MFDLLLTKYFFMDIKTTLSLNSDFGKKKKTIKIANTKKKRIRAKNKIKIQKRVSRFVYHQSLKNKN